MRRNLFTFAGLAAMLCGVLFALQGAGIIRWPASSLMIDSRSWILWGGLLVVAGGLLIAAARWSGSTRR